jgi:type IV pilus modification protein PilV
MRKRRPKVSALKTPLGFSLVEVMIAMTFLGIGLLAVAQMIPMGVASVTQARVRTNAVQAGQERLDGLKSADFYSPALTAGTYSESDGNYDIEWTVTNNDPITGSKRIVMTTQWQHFSGTKEIVLSTYVTDHD